MTLFLLNLILAIFWLALTNDVSTLNFVLGFFLSYFILYLTDRGSDYFKKTPRFLVFLLFFLAELVKSALRISADILTRKHRMLPGVIAIPLDAESDVEITLVANIISLTPGSLSLDVSRDRKKLYIHFMYIDQKDVETFRRHVKEQLECRVLELLR